MSVVTCNRCHGNSAYQSTATTLEPESFDSREAHVGKVLVLGTWESLIGSEKQPPPAESPPQQG